MADGPRRNVYEAIRSFWGEELTEVSLQRIVDAPYAHIREFRSHWLHSQSGIPGLPELPPGHLRPVVSAHTVDCERVRSRNRWGDELAAVRAALVVLLYAHQVVIDDISSYLISGDPEDRRAAGKLLISIRPLFDAGLVHFAPVTSIKHHPGSYHRNHHDLCAAVLSQKDPYVEAFVRKRLKPDLVEGDDLYDNERYHEIDELVLDTLSYDRYFHSWPNKIHRILRCRAEESILRMALGHLPTPDDHRTVQLRKLMEIAVPNFAPNAASLVSMRRNDESFGEWRQHLGFAVDKITVSDPSDHDELKQARMVINAEMEPLRHRLEKDARKSAALHALRSGSVGFGISAMAASAALLAGGSLPSALTSAGVSKGLESLAAYVKAKKDQQKSRSILDLTLLFESSKAPAPRWDRGDS